MGPELLPFLRSVCFFPRIASAIRPIRGSSCNALHCCIPSMIFNGGLFFFSGIIFFSVFFFDFCFPASLLFCFSAFMLLCFSASLLLCSLLFAFQLFSKMLQIARKTDRTADQKKQNGKNNPKTIPDPFLMGLKLVISCLFKTNRIK